MSIFDAYDQEFSSLSREIGKGVADYKADSDGKEGQVRQVEGLIAQAGDLIKQMEVEVRGHDAGTRKALTEKVNQYKRALAAQKSDFSKAREVADRSNLLGTGKSGEQRQRLLETTNDKISRQNDMIANARRTVAETEEIGVDITTELARNREKIESAHSKVHEFTGLADSARRLISSMQRRDVQQRFMMGFIAVVLIIAISVTIYFSTK